MHPWHTLSTGQVLEQLRADPVSGLAVNEARPSGSNTTAPIN